MTGARRPEDFDAWQLAWELKERVYAFTATLPARRDFKFCEEIREAARSAPDNIAEGFYRFSPSDFANFVRMARASLGEVRNQLKHAQSHGYLDHAEFNETFRVCRRALGATRELRLYLLRCPKNFDPLREAPPYQKRATQNPKVAKEPQEPQEPQEPDEP
jgi:four helix bundle protein